MCVYYPFRVIKFPTNSTESRLLSSFVLIEKNATVLF